MKCKIPKNRCLSFMPLGILLTILLTLLIVFRSKFLARTNYQRTCEAVTMGDGICDDNLNVKSCNYDDGDCCLDTKLRLLTCTICICYSGKLMSTTDAKQDASTAFTTTTTTADSSATFTTTTRPIVDWVSFPEHNLQLWMDNGDGNYYSCAENCAKIGGRLYEPKNAQEYAAVGDFASGQFNFDYWIGINNIEQESKFVYTSSGSAVTFYAWEAADLFKDKDIERCVASNYGQWQLQNCFFVKRCACEKVYTKPNPVPFSLEYLEESSSHNLPCCKAGVLKSTGSLCTEIQICNSHYDFLASLPGNKDIFVFALHGLINTYLNVYNHNGEFKLQMAVMPEAPQTRFTSIQTVNETNSFCPESFVGLQFKRYSDNSLQYDNQAHFVCQ